MYIDIYILCVYNYIRKQWRRNWGSGGSRKNVNVTHCQHEVLLPPQKNKTKKKAKQIPEHLPTPLENITYATTLTNKAYWQ